jgi:glycosyltransferase involved in cell wall biosynthesis
MKDLKKSGVELHLIGHVHGSGNGLKEYSNVFTSQPAVSQAEMFRKYSDYDALVLPSVFEGFGLVIVEALAAGLPVITTPNTIGPELIVDDSNGYIVPIRDVQAIINAVTRLASKTMEQRREMSAAARQSALSYSWNSYTVRLKELMQSI